MLLVFSLALLPAPALGQTGEGCEDGQHNRAVAAPVRAGRAAFEHYVESCGERAELAMQRTEIGGTYWYGWSMYVPEDFDEREHYTIVMQLAAWPSRRNGEFPCGGNGHKISISSSGRLEYDLQYAGEEEDSVCEEYPLADLKEVRGRWVDFVMRAKWTGDPGWDGPPSRTIYTDEYRLGDADAGFEAVSPVSDR